MGDNSGLLRHLLITAITVAGVAVIMWLEAPDWQKEMISRGANLRLHGLAAGLARAAGHSAMGDELKGRASEARAGYRVTERLSRLRDRLREA